MGVPEHRDGIVGQFAELGGPHAGPIEHHHHQSIAGQAVGVGCGHELGRVLIGEELGQGLGSRGDVTVENRVPVVGLGPVPLDEPLEEDPDHPQDAGVGCSWPGSGPCSRAGRPARPCSPRRGAG